MPVHCFVLEKQYYTQFRGPFILNQSSFSTKASQNAEIRIFHHSVRFCSHVTSHNGFIAVCHFDVIEQHIDFLSAWKLLFSSILAIRKYFRNVLSFNFQFILMIFISYFPKLWLRWL